MYNNLLIRYGSGCFHAHRYFSPESNLRGLSYDFLNQIEINFTGASCRLGANVQDYNKIKTSIENLPEMQLYEVIAFFCIRYDDAGMNIRFACRDRQSKEVKKTPFLGYSNYSAPHACMMIRNPLKLVELVLKQREINSGGKNVPVGQYLTQWCRE